MHKTPLSRNEVLLEEILNKMDNIEVNGDGGGGSSADDGDIQDILDDMYGDDDQSGTTTDPDIQDILDDMYGGG